jgi:hypothetical protein
LLEKDARAGTDRQDAPALPETHESGRDVLHVGNSRMPRDERGPLREWSLAILGAQEGDPDQFPRSETGSTSDATPTATSRSGLARTRVRVSCAARQRRLTQTAYVRVRRQYCAAEACALQISPAPSRGTRLHATVRTGICLQGMRLAATRTHCEFKVR